MYQWKQAGRLEAVVYVTVMLLTPTISCILPTESTEPTETTEQSLSTEMTNPTTSAESDCNQVDGRYHDCACDPQCARYGDCCRTSPYFVPEEQRLGASPFTCMILSHLLMYVMATCPPDWKDSDSRNRCEHPDRSYRDPLFDAPVTSFSTHTTYANWHCAFCHGDLDADTTLIWDAWFVCCDSSRHGLSDETIVEHVSFNPLTSKWNLNISLPTSDMKVKKSTPGYIQPSTDNNEQDIHCNCYVLFTVPVENLPSRGCIPYEIRTCSEGWKDAEVKAQCEAYTDRECYGHKIYRNIHCVQCNNVTLVNFCAKGTLSPYRPPSFVTLLDWKILNKGNCTSSEVYDTKRRKCRKVFI